MADVFSGVVVVVVLVVGFSVEVVVVLMSSKCIRVGVKRTAQLGVQHMPVAPPASLLALAHLLANVDPYRTQLFVVAGLLTATGCECGQFVGKCIETLTSSALNCSKMSKWDGRDDNASPASDKCPIFSGRKPFYTRKCQKLDDNDNLEHRPRICTEFPRRIVQKSRSINRILRSASLTSYSRANKVELQSFVEARQKSFDQLRRIICLIKDCQRLRKKAKPRKMSTIIDSSPKKRCLKKSALIAYRKFLVTAGEINEYDVSKSNIGLYTPTEDGQQKGIFLPTLFNIFGVTFF